MLYYIILYVKVGNYHPYILTWFSLNYGSFYLLRIWIIGTRNKYLQPGSLENGYLWSCVRILTSVIVSIIVVFLFHIVFILTFVGCKYRCLNHLTYYKYITLRQICFFYLKSKIYLYPLTFGVLIPGSLEIKSSLRDDFKDVDIFGEVVRLITETLCRITSVSVSLCRITIHFHNFWLKGTKTLWHTSSLVYLVTSYY